MLTAMRSLPLLFLAALAGCASPGAASGAPDASPPPDASDAAPDANGTASSPDAASLSPDAGTTCEEAGGTCLIGSNICATPGSQYCPGETSPAGTFCCLSQVEDCGQPAAITFAPSCTSSSAGCQDPPPAPSPFFQADAGPIPPGPFAPGCSVTFPYCNQGVVTTCVCQGANWSCSL
jgi:hypothetical protein